jgi:hypothetical protein
MSGARERLITDALLDGLDEARLRRRPAPRLNAIAWLLWHMARSEDVAANVLLGDGRQVLDAGWAALLGLSQRAMGTGMHDAETEAVAARIALPALLAYRDAVGRRTRTIAAALTEEDLARPIAPERLLAADAFSDVEEGERRVQGYWRGRDVLFVLTSAIASHQYLHLGEAQCIKSLLSARDPSMPRPH